ncbi:MAG: hypothetical protein EOO27_48775 [Comamonadaceae bacterium]|nr:MAG: hypothetical protein EOO27_48775 [Comamonadaceae bacterium]
MSTDSCGVPPRCGPVSYGLPPITSTTHPLHLSWSRRARLQGVLGLASGRQMKRKPTDYLRHIY